MAAQHNFQADSGATFSRVLSWRNPDGTPVDLTGWSATWRARRKLSDAAAVIDEVPVVDGPAGTVTLALTGAETALLSGRYVYAVRLSAGGGEPSERLVEGVIDFSPDVVR